MGKAAAELAISQPSISKAIAEVEHTMGLRLLDRTPHGVEPIIYGQALHKCGVAVFDELRMADRESQWGRRRRINLSELLDEFWVLPPVNSISGGVITRVFRASGVEPPTAHMVSFSLPVHYTAC